MLLRVENRYCFGLKISVPQVQRLKGIHLEDLDVLEFQYISNL